MDLQRFVEAQDPVWRAVTAELSAGRKRSHWMWFVFPQIAGLGRSEMAQRYAIPSPKEARAYLAHDLLGPRLQEATRLAMRSPAASAEALFGGIDAVKFRSSMTLFAQAAGDPAPFREALARWYGGRQDEATLAILGRG